MGPSIEKNAGRALAHRVSARILMMTTLDAFAGRLGLATSVELDLNGRPVVSVDEGEQIAHSYPCVELVITDDMTSLGSGTLHVTTRRVLHGAASPWAATLCWLPTPAPRLPRRRIVWVGGGSTAASVGMTYPQVAMHAISKDPAAFAKPCIYLQLDEGDEAGALGAGGDEGDEEEEEEPAAEVRLVPSDEALGARVVQARGPPGGWPEPMPGARARTERPPPPSHMFVHGHTRGSGGRKQAAAIRLQACWRGGSAQLHANPHPTHPPHPSTPPHPTSWPPAVEELFKALCDCSAMNPDPDMEGECHAPDPADPARQLAVWVPTPSPESPRTQKPHPQPHAPAHTLHAARRTRPSPRACPPPHRPCLPGLT